MKNDKSEFSKSFYKHNSSIIKTIGIFAPMVILTLATTVIGLLTSIAPIVLVGCIGFSLSISTLGLYIPVLVVQYKKEKKEYNEKKETDVVELKSVDMILEKDIKETNNQTKTKNEQKNNNFENELEL